MWPDGLVENGNLPQQVYLLRKALAVDPTVSIESVARTGYRLCAAIGDPRADRSLRSRRAVRALFATVVATAILALPSGASLLRTPAGLPLVPGLRDYQLGRYFWERRGVANLQIAKGYFELVVAAAPSGADGYAGLAEVWGVLADGVPVNEPAHVVLARRAYRAARLAVERDENSAVGHAALGLALLQLGAPEADGITELRRAIALDPSNPEAHEWYGMRLLFAGRLSEADREMEIASSLQPTNVAVASWHALTRYYLHDGNTAVSGFRTALEINPAFDLAQIGLVAALVERGRYRDALVEARRQRGGMSSTSRALSALCVIAELRLGFRTAAEAEARRLRTEVQARDVGDDDGFVVAAFAVDGRRSDALRLRDRLHLHEPYQRLVSDFDPVVAPIMRTLGNKG